MDWMEMISFYDVRLFVTLQSVVENSFRVVAYHKDRRLFSSSMELDGYFYIHLC